MLYPGSRGVEHCSNLEVTKALIHFYASLLDEKSDFCNVTKMEKLEIFLICTSKERSGSRVMNECLNHSFTARDLIWLGVRGARVG
jgi:hypothetical protein